jgi:hypothetical protein
MEPRIEYMPLSQLERWPRNPKKHADAIITSSIERFGFVQPLLIDENTKRLVAGHGRLETLLSLKQRGGAPPERIVDKDGEWLVPVLRGVGFESEKEAEAYLIADNQTTILGGWDDKALQTILEGHTNDLSGMGFTPADIAAFRMPIDPEKPQDPRTDMELHVNWMHPESTEAWLRKMIIGKTLNVCCGLSQVGDVRIDTDSKTARTIQGDLFNLKYKPGSFDTVICDPPFGYYKDTRWILHLSHIAKKRLLLSSGPVALNNLLPRFKANLYALTSKTNIYYLRLYWIFDRKA